jgi:hypothetical protein
LILERRIAVTAVGKKLPNISRPVSIGWDS